MKKLSALHFTLSLISFFSHSFLHAQSSHTPTILGLMEYRNELIAENAEGFKKIYELDELWKSEQKESVDQFMFNIIYAHEIYGMSAEKIIEQYEKMETDSSLTPLLTEEKIMAIIQNHDLIDLLNGGFLKPDPPFQIDSKTTLFDELDFYEINNGMGIAEIGAGNGMFSLLLGLGYDSLHVFVNDIDAFPLKYAKKKIDNCASKKGSNKYEFIKGKKKSTELENNSIDKIIIRNSFHHFSHKKEMLTSIKKALKANGDLYIFDPILNSGETHDCEYVMDLKEIKKLISENGFQIIKEKMVESSGMVLMHFRPYGE